MARRRCSKRWNWRAALLAGALAAALAPGGAQAGGLFDFLFGDAPDQQPPPPPSYAEPPPLGPVAPVPLGPESVRQSGGSTGRVVAYCVRLCDGQHFPLEHMTNATPVETCRAMCPASKTKIFFGSDIGAAVAKDGARYADLDTAFIYRKQLVANCTCNGRDAFGLAPFDLSSDPTLRPGDIVATKARPDGLYRQDRQGRRLHAGRCCERRRRAELGHLARCLEPPRRTARRSGRRSRRKHRRRRRSTSAPICAARSPDKASKLSSAFRAYRHSPDLPFVRSSRG